MLFMSDFDQTWIFSTDFDNYENIKFHVNSFSGNRIIPCGRTDGPADRQTDMTRLIVDFRSFEITPNKTKQDYVYRSCLE